MSLKKSSVVGIGVIGYGYWGPNLVRNFAEIDGSQVVAVCDLNPDRLAKARARYPAIQATRDACDLIKNPAIDAIVIATPVASHCDLATRALRSGKHVLVEKPLAAAVDQAERMIEAAHAARRVLMVDHTFVYSGAVRKIKELIDSGRLGRLYYYDSVRVNLGLFLHDLNVLWDLAVHDLSILDYLFGKLPQSVSATGTGHLPKEPTDVAYLTCFFAENFIAHFHANWLAPVKIRRTLIGGDRRMIVYDDMEADEKIKVYDKGVRIRDGAENIYQMLVSYRTGDMWAPKLDRTEALRVEALHFLECVTKNRSPITDGETGLRIVRVLDAADRSLRLQGSHIDLSNAHKNSKRLSSA